MFANWKSAIYEYAYRRNKLEADGELEQLASIVRDSRYMQETGQLVRRRHASRSARGISPVRAETGMSIRSSDESERQAVVKLEFRRSLEYEQSGVSFREDRVDRETITVCRKGKQWEIVSVLPEIAERRPASPPPAFVPIPPENDERERVRSAPFLNSSVFPAIAADSSARVRTYDRRKAQQYAETWWNGYNPKYEHFEVDCTNFVSQCLFAGGAPMDYTGKRESGWWYTGRQGNRELWSFSWAVAHSLNAYLSSGGGRLRAEPADSPRKLAIGDVICYDWDGDGRFQHNTIVTAFDAAGMPLVNAHTVNSRARYWDYRDSYAWSPKTRYRFYHIADVFN